MSSPLHKGIYNEVRRRIFEESMHRIRLCLDQLTEEQVWEKPNDASNSIGNLILHLEGNARQYVVSALGGLPDYRNRQKEFDEEGPVSNEALKGLLFRLQHDMEATLQQLEASNDQEQLLKEVLVQGFKETGLSILIHVTEHFSYHTGQIALLTKLHRNEDLGFYAGLDLNITGKDMHDA